jgi:hypothetical protein
MNKDFICHDCRFWDGRKSGKTEENIESCVKHEIFMCGMRSACNDFVKN